MPDKIKPRNIKLEIEYDGTNYAGWQVQNSPKPYAVSRKSTIQAEIEKTLRRVLKEKVRLTASGRTDAGVHALGQVANFKTVSRIPLLSLQKGLNSLLPDDIVVRDIEEKPLTFHSRFSAKSKTYRYVIINRAYPDAFKRNAAYFFPRYLDLARMRREARALAGRHDFSSFRGAGSKGGSAVRKIFKVKVAKIGGELNIDIEADGFLYNMARNIVGILLEAGIGRLGIGGVRRIMLARDRGLSGPRAPARGLYLMKVCY